MNTNPIFRHMAGRQKDRRWPLWIWFLGVMVLSVVMLMWVHIVDYDSDVLRTVATVLCLPTILMMMLISTVVVTVITREKNADAYELLYMTNIPTWKVVWGYFGAMIVRLRMWGILFVWSLSTILIMIAYNNAIESGGFYFRVNRILPPLKETLNFFLVYPLFAVGIFMLGMSGSVFEAMRQRPRRLSAGGFVAPVFSLAVFGGILGAMLMGFLSLIDHVGWLLIVLGLIVVFNLIIIFLAKRWRIYWRYGLDRFLGNLAAWIILWFAIFVYAAYVGHSDGHFLMEGYSVVLGLWVGQMLLMSNAIEIKTIGKIMQHFAVFLGIVFLILNGFRDVQPLEVYFMLTVISVVFVVLHYSSAAIYLRKNDENPFTLPRYIPAFGMTAALFLFGWPIRATLSTQFDALPHYVILNALLVIALLGRLVVKWGKYTAIEALAGLLTQVLLWIMILIGLMNDIAAVQFGLSYVVWVIIAALYSMTVRNLRLAQRFTWKFRTA